MNQRGGSEVLAPPNNRSRGGSEVLAPPKNFPQNLFNP